MAFHKKKHSPPVFEELEPRLLFSADVMEPAAGAVIQDIQEEPAITANLESETVQHEIIVDQPVVTENVTVPEDPQQNQEATVSEDTATTSAGNETNNVTAETDHETKSTVTTQTTNTPQEEPSDTTETREVVLVNNNIYEYEELVEDIRQEGDTNRRIEVIILDAEQNGIQQVTEALSDYNNLDAIHFITHGNDGEISIGNSQIKPDSLEENRSSLMSWGNALGDDGDILFYGCNIASSSDGQGLLDDIADITGADVAASDDNTGHTSLRGDWDLEYQHGVIETDILINPDLQLRWTGALDTTSGLVAHWTFDEGSGTTVTDSSTNSNDGTLTDAPTYVAGYLGPHALDFNGDYDRVVVPDDASLNFGSGNFSVSFWFSSDQTEEGQHRLIGDLSNDYGFIFFSDSGTLKFQATGDADTTVMDLNDAFDAEWHHVVGVRNGDDFILYVDNTVYRISTVAVGDINTTNTLKIGSSSDSSNEFDGLMDDIRLYNRALTATDINELYTNLPPNDITLTQKTSVTINNPGFEAQALDDGDTAAPVTDWTDSGDSGVWNPDQASYTQETPEGENIAYVSATAGGHTLSQELAETFQSGKSYDLSALIGDEIGAAETTTWEMRLYAGNQLLGSVGNADFDPSEDSFVRATLHLDADSLSAFSSVYGENLKIEFYNDDAGGDEELHVDDVQLEYTAISINENAANGTVVADVASVTDPNAGDSHTFTLTDNAGGRFAIGSNSGDITVADSSLLDYETTTSHNITVRATDAGGLTYNEVLTIQVANVNEAPTFYQESDGIVTTDVGADHDFGRSLIMQPDGKILVSGISANGTDKDIVLLRYNVDGSLDTSFSSDGMLTTAVGSDNDSGNSVIVQSDGKILVAGDSNNGTDYDFSLVRYNTDGTLDTSFSTDGMLTTDIGTHDDFGRSITLQSDGKILVAGYSNNGTDNDFSLVRYNTDGSLDTDFSNDGMLTTNIGTHNDYGMDVTLQADGRILVAGIGSNGTDYDFALVRYNTDGTLDTGFNTDGILTTAIGAGDDEAYGVVVQSDGKILMAGGSMNGTNYDFAIARYNNDASLDTSFDTDGMVTTDIDANFNGGLSITLQPDGKILVAGDSFNGRYLDFALIRYNYDGTLDTSFSDDGKLTTTVGTGSSYSKSVVVQDDGKILVVGSSYNGSNSDIALIRYNSDGTLDSSFDTVYTLDGNPTFTEDSSPVVLDADVQIFDAELDATDNFSGATLTLSRNGGADAEDFFSATGNLAALTEGASLVLSGTTIGTVTTNNAGTLNLTLDANATQDLVNETMQSIAYANNSDTPPASAQINWVFDDGNTGSQGTGGAIQATGSTSVTIIAVNDAPVITSADAVNAVANQTDVTTVTATDRENDTVSFSITGGVDQALFTIDPNSGAVTFNSAPDYENPADDDADNTYIVEVTVNDGNSGTDTHTITVTVTNVNEAPVNSISPDNSNNSTDGNETHSNVDNENKNTDNTTVINNDEEIIDRYITDEGLPNVDNGAKYSENTDHITVTNFEDEQAENGDIVNEENPLEAEQSELNVNTGSSTKPIDTITSFTDQPSGYHALSRNDPQQKTKALNSEAQIQKQADTEILIKSARKVTSPPLELMTPTVKNSFHHNKVTYPDGIQITHETMRAELSFMHMEMDQAFEHAAKKHRVQVYMASGISASFAIGTASYLLRGGSLLSSFLTTIPLWKGFDPVAILSTPKKKMTKNENAPQEDIHTPTSSTEQKVENIFDGTIGS